MAVSKRKKARRKPHPGVTLIPPRGAYTSWRARFKSPDTGKYVWQRLDPLTLNTADLRTDWAIEKSRSLGKRAMALDDGATRETGTSIQTAIDRFKAGNPHLAKETLDIYGITLNRFKAWCSDHGVKTTDKINRARVVHFREYLINAKKRASAVGQKKNDPKRETKEPRKPASINRDLQTMRTVLNYWRRAQLIPYLTRDDIDDTLQGIRDNKERLPFLKYEELAELIEALLAFDRERSHTAVEQATPYFVFLLLTGCRKNEPFGLEWSHVDFVAHEIHVPAHIVKTRQARTIDTSVCPLLEEMLKKMHASSKGERIFTLKEHASEYVLKHIQKPAFTCGTLRRTCGTYLTCAPSIFSAASAFRSATQLGHSVTVAQRIYVGVVKDIPKSAKTLEAAMKIEKQVRKVIASIR